MGGPGSGRRKKLDLPASAPEDQPATVVKTTTRSRPTVFKVKTAAGTEVEVLTAKEKSFYDSQLKKYTHEFKFTEASDLADLDRLLFQELLDFRWTAQMGRGKNYENIPLAPALEDQYRRNKNEAAKVIGQIKAELGMNRASRDASMDSPSEYIRTLLKRAKEFGVHRNNQVVAALTLFNELASIVGTFDRSNALERSKTGFETDEDITEWIRSEAIPRFRAIDEAFTNGPDGQRYWSGL